MTEQPSTSSEVPPEPEPEVELIRDLTVQPGDGDTVVGGATPAGPCRVS